MKLISKDVCGRRCLKAGVAKNYYQVQHVTMTTLRVASTHILLQFHYQWKLHMLTKY